MSRSDAHLTAVYEELSRPDVELTALDEEIRAGLRSYFQCRESHSPLPCYRRHDRAECMIRSMITEWRKKPLVLTPENEDPLVFALAQAGCNRYRAKMVLTSEGYGMHDISHVIAAYLSQTERQKSALSKNIGVCSQCKPGTNTFTWVGSRYASGSTCRRIAINPSRFAAELQNGSPGVLCLGRDGKLQFCAPGEFMAVSHVWDHGWQGTSEEGICSRLLETLLDTAADFGLSWVWLDVAMIGRDPITRALSVNGMNQVYTTAKVTLVCDRLLLSMEGGSDREKVFALAVSDWMTRIWTMQEALLSKNLVIAQRDHHWNTSEMIRSLALNDDPLNWQAYDAVRTLIGMVEVVTNDIEAILERTFFLCRERLTTKQVDFARALFPLFNLTWPGPNTSLIQGQLILLKHLGQHAARCVGLHGPIGLPSPYSWAPLTLAGTSGALTSRGRAVTSSGLMGAWSWKEVKATQRESTAARSGRLSEGEGMGGLLNSLTKSVKLGTGANLSKFGSLREIGSAVMNDIYRGYMTHAHASWDSATHSNRMAELTGGTHDFMTFVDSTGRYCLSALVYYHPTEPFPWSGCRQFLIGNAERSKQNENDHYDLVIVQSSDNEWYEMHRVGSVYGPWIEMADEKQSIQGILF